MSLSCATLFRDAPPVALNALRIAAMLASVTSLNPMLLSSAVVRAEGSGSPLASSMILSAMLAKPSILETVLISPKIRDLTMSLSNPNALPLLAVSMFNNPTPSVW